MAKRNCISSLLCALVFAYFLYQCSFLKVSAAYWPKLICIAGLGLSVLECAAGAFRWLKETEGQRSLMPLSAKQLKRYLAMVVIMVIWITGLNKVGFLACSAAALCLISCLYEMERNRKNMIRNIVVSVLFAVLFYGVFSYLGIHFPKALLF